MKKKISFILMPDTQKMARNHPKVFMKMTKWITNYANETRLDAVVHLGDVVDHGALVEEEYLHANEALNVIYEADIPLFIVPGNHDYDTPVVSKVKEIEEDKRRNLNMFNTYFGVDRSVNQSWFGGVFEEGKAENIYTFVNDFLFVMLEFGPRDEVLEWANKIIYKYPEKNVIIITHCYLYIDGERTSDESTASPKKYIATRDANDGAEIWDKLIKHHKNIRAVFSGHHIPINVSYRVDTGDAGNQVVQCFQNWQSEDKGGAGRIRIVEMDIDASIIEMNVFNTWTEKFEHEPGYDLIFKIKTANMEMK